jgi:hypothetical protein
LQPVGHRGRGAHLVSLDNGDEAPEPISQFGDFATGEGALGHDTMVAYGEQQWVEGASTIIAPSS